MVQINSFLTVLAATIILLSGTCAHPGEHEGHSAFTLARRAHFNEQSRRSIEACKGNIKSRDLVARAIARRAALAEEVRTKRGIQKRGRRRGLSKVLAKDHETNLTDVSLDTGTEELFSGDVKCIVHPEALPGPFYVTGELIRHDIREGEPGVDLWGDIQVVDINTCEPVPDLYLDWWQANATGVYSGVVAAGNGDSSDQTNLNKSSLRGIWPTNSDGVAQFLTIFPGHYARRTNHVHILAHTNPDIHRNQTLIGGRISHVGQVFFDQSLIDQVELTEPYASNTQKVELNSQDFIFVEVAASMDSVMEYVLLGDSVEEGIMAWITLGVDLQAEYSISSASTWTAHGGVPNSGTGSSGGPVPSGV